MTSKRQYQKLLDTWFPTVVRYSGVVLLIYSTVIDRGNNPALIPAAGGMILFKTIYAHGPPDEEESEKKS